MAIRRSPEEIGRLGDAIYERDIRPHVETTHHGKIVSIDVDSGDYAVGDSVIAATDRLRDGARTRTCGACASAMACCDSSEADP